MTEGGAGLEVCVCGFEGPAVTGPRHAGFNASAGCWAAFGEVLAREYTTPALWPVHQLSVDAYAAQHPGGAHPDKSVAIHLVGLHLVLERGLATSEVARRHKHLADTVREWPHCEPPVVLGSVRAGDVARARSAEGHIKAVRGWAAAVWRAWSMHHAAIAEFARAAGVEVALGGGSHTSGNEARRRRG